MSTLEPFERLEAILFDLCPHARNLRVIIQDLDQPQAEATSITFHRGARPVGLSSEFMPVEIVRVTPKGDLPMVSLPPTAKVLPADLALLELLDREPGLKGATVARRLGVTAETAYRRLGRLVKKLGWVRSSHHDGYVLTAAGKAALARGRSGRPDPSAR